MSDLRFRTTAPAESNVTAPFKESPSQTAGPYVHIGCLPNFLGINGVFECDLTTSSEVLLGTSISIRGSVFDGEGSIGKDFMIESWQADHKGDLSNGIWQRVPTDLKTGEFSINTILPGSLNGASPHINLWIVARGLNLGLHTKLYFDDHDYANDPVMALVPMERRHSLIAVKNGNHYQFDIHLQGEKETVFFDV